jgi:hypothetical protein
MPELNSLIVEARLVGSEDLGRAEEISAATGLPLGRVLMLKQMISFSLWENLLDVQTLLHEGQIDRRTAVDLLCICQRQKSSAMNLVSEMKADVASPNLRLGQMLVKAGIITEIELMNCLEVSLRDGRHLGAALTELGFVKRTVLDVAILLENQTTIYGLDAEEALSRLRFFNDRMKCLDSKSETTGRAKTKTSELT